MNFTNMSKIQTELRGLQWTKNTKTSPYTLLKNVCYLKSLRISWANSEQNSYLDVSKILSARIKHQGKRTIVSKTKNYNPFLWYVREFMILLPLECTKPSLNCLHLKKLTTINSPQNCGRIPSKFYWSLKKKF